MIFDSHTHTTVSADGEMTGSEAVAAARAQGIGIVFTEHIDFDYPGDLVFEFDADEYMSRYASLRAADVRLGVEVGMQPQTLERTREFVHSAPFDEVIGSIHLVDGQDIYEPACYAGTTKETFYRRYFELMAQMVHSHGDFIDVLGHIDYIARYATYDDPELDYATFRAEIDDVLRACLATDTVLELNTRRLASQRALESLRPIYARYHELGGRFITLGSDAHQAAAVGANFASAGEFVRGLGLNIVSFSGRQRI